MSGDTTERMFKFLGVHVASDLQSSAMQSGLAAKRITHSSAPYAVVTAMAHLYREWGLPVLSFAVYAEVKKATQAGAAMLPTAGFGHRKFGGIDWPSARGRGFDISTSMSSNHHIFITFIIFIIFAIERTVAQQSRGWKPWPLDCTHAQSFSRRSNVLSTGAVPTCSTAAPLVSPAQGTPGTLSVVLSGVVATALRQERTR